MFQGHCLQWHPKKLFKIRSKGIVWNVILRHFKNNILQGHCSKLYQWDSMTLSEIVSKVIVITKWWKMKEPNSYEQANALFPFAKRK